MPFLNLQEIAPIVGAKPQVLRKMAVADKIPATKIGRRWMFDPDLVQEALRKRMLEGTGREDKPPPIKRPKHGIKRMNDHEAREKLAKILGK